MLINTLGTMSSSIDAAWKNEKTLREVQPQAVEHLVFEVRASAFERWKAAEFEYWTKGLADRYPSFLGKETWVSEGPEWHKVTVILYWEDVASWHAIDTAWLEEHERAFADAVGADNVRLIGEGHKATQYFKISEYR